MTDHSTLYSAPLSDGTGGPPRELQICRLQLQSGRRLNTAQRVTTKPHKREHYQKICIRSLNAFQYGREPTAVVTETNTETTADQRDAVTSDCRRLRQCFYVLFVAAQIYCLATCPWSASLVPASGGNCLLNLPTSPIWSPPETPTYADFVKSLPSLGGTPEPPHPPRVYPNIGSLFFHFVLWLWLLCVVVAIIYSTLFQRYRDWFLDIVWWTAISMTTSAMLCIILWIALGGWGPPALILFAFAGLIAGPCIAFLRQNQSGRAAEILAEKRNRPG